MHYQPVLLLYVVSDHPIAFHLYPVTSVKDMNTIRVSSMVETPSRQHERKL